MRWVLPILQRRKLRPREVEELAQGHTAKKRQSQDLNSGSLAPKSVTIGSLKIS